MQPKNMLVLSENKKVFKYCDFSKNLFYSIQIFSELPKDSVECNNYKNTRKIINWILSSIDFIVLKPSLIVRLPNKIYLIYKIVQMQPTAPTPRTSKIWNLIEINMNIDLGLGQAAFRNKNTRKPIYFIYIYIDNRFYILN